MATPALIVVITVALVTLGTLALTILFLVGQLKVLAATVRQLREDLDPALERLSQDAAITRTELERIGQATSELGGDGERDRVRPDPGPR